MGVNYVRLNTEDSADERRLYDPHSGLLAVISNGRQLRLNTHDIRSLYFRRPVFLRSSNPTANAERHFSATQNLAFELALAHGVVGRKMNCPAATYRAECKPLQLTAAAALGCTILETWVTNAPRDIDSTEADFAVKCIDGLQLSEGGSSFFVYTEYFSRDDLVAGDFAGAPVIVQRYAKGKTDWRITVVGDRVFSTKVSIDGGPLADDWRKHQKHSLQFESLPFPDEEKDRAIRLCQNLGLTFGALDYVECDGIFYFLEINPTGEWAWLTETSKQPIQIAIAEELARPI
jgi:hypothetical protein